MKHYPPHEYKVHRRVAGGGFVCNPNWMAGVDPATVREFFYGVTRGLNDRNYHTQSSNRPDVARLGYNVARQFT